jgi:hypothetical protein
MDGPQHHSETRVTNTKAKYDEWSLVAHVVLTSDVITKPRAITFSLQPKMAGALQLLQWLAFLSFFP